MSTTKYPVFFTKTVDIILIEVPDFGILTEGKDMEDAIEMARDAILLICMSLEEDNQSIPTPSDKNKLDLSKAVFAKEGETTISLVDLETSKCEKNHITE